MDGLSAAASVIAVIDMSAKVASLCSQYINAVKSAKEDIQRLQKKADSIKLILGGLKHQLEGPNGTRLSTTHKLMESLQECFVLLQKLETQLEPSKTRKAMSRFGGRALKWPFESKQITEIVANLETYEQAFSLSLQIDQTNLILEFDQKIDLAKLPIATGASFDSHLEEHNSKCLADTRVEIRHQIMDWAQRKDQKNIFWLSGMAGTGKSTISRTVAQSFADQGQLGASFFFKRGEGERGNASRFFTTVASDLIKHIPRLKPMIREVIELEPAIAEKSLKDQFYKLILDPLSKTQETSLREKEFVIVIDALDECDREEDIRAILRLLTQTRDVIAIVLRVFVTSRPELPIRLGFKQMPDGTYQDLILHEVARETIAQDIALFFENELAKIRDQRSLDPLWPGEQKIQTLVGMAVPLFIFAATVCRFLGEASGNPQRRLKDILAYDEDDVSKQDATYLPILNPLFTGCGEKERARLSKEFQDIIGTIVILESPLSVISIAKLLEIAKEDVNCRLDSLHSVLSIPNDEAGPIRLLHLSFRDFLVNPAKKGMWPFWIDEQEAHEMLTQKCLQLMSSSLRQNICNLPSPGSSREDIDHRIANENLTPELRYACRYWVTHLQRGKCNLYSNNLVHKFLQKFALNWLEAMSLMGEVSESINMINNLRSHIDHSELSAFIQDFRRFALWIRPALDVAPLQLYSSGLIFAPEKSIMRKEFNTCAVKSIHRLSRIQDDWNALLQSLEGHSLWVNSVVFSPDGGRVASSSSDSTIRLWDPATGSLQQTLEGHSRGVCSVVFSLDGTQLVSISYDQTIKLWDTATGALQQTFKCRCRPDDSTAFSHDGRYLAISSTERTITLWDTATGNLHQTIEGHSDRIYAITFSPDGTHLASGSDDNLIKLWDIATGSIQQTFEGHSNRVRSVAFSPDGRQLASGSGDEWVKLWDAATGSVQQTFGHPSHLFRSVAFSPEGRQLASGFDDGTINLWNTTTGSLEQILKGHSYRVKSLAFSPDSRQLVSGSEDKVIRLWDVATERSSQRTLEGHLQRVSTVAFSSDGVQLASGSWDGTIKLWEIATGVSLQRTLDDLGVVYSVAFSPDGKRLVSGDLETVKLWDPATGSLQMTLEGHPDTVDAISFSPDGSQLAFCYMDGTLEL